jgi:hypothetical protein
MNLYDLYIQMTPPGQRVPGLERVSDAALLSFLRTNRPDVLRQYETLTAPPVAPTVPTYNPGFGSEVGLYGPKMTDQPSMQGSGFFRKAADVFAGIGQAGADVLSMGGGDYSPGLAPGPGGRPMPNLARMTDEERNQYIRALGAEGALAAGIVGAGAGAAALSARGLPAARAATFSVGTPGASTTAPVGAAPWSGGTSLELYKGAAIAHNTSVVTTGSGAAARAAGSALVPYTAPSTGTALVPFAGQTAGAGARAAAGAARAPAFTVGAGGASTTAPVGAMPWTGSTGLVATGRVTSAAAGAPSAAGAAGATARLGRAAIPFIGAAAAGPVFGPSIDRELREESARRRETGDPATLGGHLGAIGRGIVDPGAPGRGPIGTYLAGPARPTVDFTGTPVGTPGSTLPPRPAPAPTTPIDVQALIDAMGDGGAGGGGGGGGGGGVGGGGGRAPSSMFSFEETEAEREMLRRALAEISRRETEGRTELRKGWGDVQRSNAAAAEKAAALVTARGDRGEGFWTGASERTARLAAERAQAAGGFEGRAAIDIDPTGGASEWINFMESQAPAERALAESQQQGFADDLDWMAGMSGAMGEAYSADIARMAAMMAFEREQSHTQSVQNRINEERMLAAQMDFQAQQAAAARAGATGNTATRILSSLREIAPLLPTGDASNPQNLSIAAAMLASAAGIDAGMALSIVQAYQSGIGGQALMGELAKLLGSTG